MVLNKLALRTEQDLCLAKSATRETSQQWSHGTSLQSGCNTSLTVVGFRQQTKKWTICHSKCAPSTLAMVKAHLFQVWCADKQKEHPPLLMTALLWRFSWFWRLIQKCRLTYLLILPYKG